MRFYISKLKYWCLKYFKSTLFSYLLYFSYFEHVVILVYKLYSGFEKTTVQRLPGSGRLHICETGKFWLNQIRMGAGPTWAQVFLRKATEKLESILIVTLLECSHQHWLLELVSLLQEFYPLQPIQTITFIFPLSFRNFPLFHVWSTLRY